MELVKTDVEEVSIITLPTRLVMANADTTRAEVKRIIDSGRHHLIFDLSDVDFVDSSGLSVLVFGLKATKARDGNVVLYNPCEDVMSLIELTRLHEIFEIFTDKDAAIERLNAEVVPV